MTEFDPVDGEAHVIVGVSDAALHMYRAAIESLPFPEDKKFQKRVEVVLTGLRKLRTSLTEGGRYSRSTPAVVASLSEVRRLYDDLMARVAVTPSSTLGQQLYTVRTRAKLSAAEVVCGAGLNPGLPDRLEIGGNPTEAETKKIQGLIDALGGLTQPEVPAQAETEVNGVNNPAEKNGSKSPVATTVG